jgi:hypothetical protein
MTRHPWQCDHGLTSGQTCDRCGRHVTRRVRSGEPMYQEAAQRIRARETHTQECGFYLNAIGVSTWICATYCPTFIARYISIRQVR